MKTKSESTKKSKDGPVIIREKVLKNGRVSLYLDVYCNGRRSYEFLKLHHEICPKNEAERTERKNARLAAEKMKAQRITEITEGRFNMVSGNKGKMLLVDLLDMLLEKKKKADRGESSVQRIEKAKTILRTYFGDKLDKLTLAQVDEGFVRGYIQYLKTADSSRGRAFTNRTQHYYQSALKEALDLAVRNCYISVNPFNRLDNEEVIRMKCNKKGHEYLETSEIKSLMATPCPNHAVGVVFLFSVFTGLRISDIRQLRWTNIRMKEGRPTIILTMKKTKGEIEIPLSVQAQKLLSDRGASDELVFPDIPSEVTLNNNLRKWGKLAGVDKYLHFHMGRHSFAVSAIASGVDLFTVSKLLGHADVGVTQVYADVLGSSKRAAIDKLDAVWG